MKQKNRSTFQTIIRRSLSFFAGIFMILLSACAPSTQNQVSSRGAIKRNSDVSTAALNCTSSVTRTPGVIYHESYDGQNFSTTSFEQRARDFVSATLNPSELGSLVGSKTSATKITLGGRISYDAAGNILPNDSSLDILIYDSLVGEVDSSGKTISAYPITMTSAVSGKIDRARQTFTAIFQDEYGSISLQGSYSSTQMTGRIDFVNTQSVDGSHPKSGVLGAFSIGTCSFL